MTGISYTHNAYVHVRGVWQADTAYAVNDQVTAAGAVWNCLVAHTSGSTFTGGSDWQLVGGTASLTQTITTSQNVTAPIWATVAGVTVVGAGGGGGGAGSALTSGGVTAQGSGGGGGAGGITRRTLPVTGGSVCPVTIAAGGTGGAGGAANGNTGTSGGNGGASSVVVNGQKVYAPGGQGAAFSGGNTTSGGPGAAPSAWFNGGSNYVDWVPGSGFDGTVQYPTPPLDGAAAGENGQAASSTNGGLGGYAQQLTDGIGWSQQAFSGSGSSATANGGAGQTPTSPGCGGGGGGGGAPGGAGGAGGNGGPGLCVIEWRSQ